MIKSSHKITLICDSNLHSDQEPFVKTFYAKSRSGCLAEAKRQGWDIDLNKGVSICKNCALQKIINMEKALRAALSGN